MQLDLFTILARGPRSPATLAAQCDLQPAGMQRLLEAAAGLRLVSRRGGRYGLGPLGAAIVENPGVAAMITHHAPFYADLADPVRLLREGRGEALSGYWGYAGAADPSCVSVRQAAPYSAVMAASQPLVAVEILDAYDVRRHRMLLDVGGGEGVFLAAAAARAPALQLALFDLPAVVERAAASLTARGVPARISGGDMFADRLPAGADLVTLIRVLHDHDDAAVRTLLRAVRAALAPGGTLLVAEPMAGTPGAERMGETYFGFYLLAMGQGRPRTSGRLRALLDEAGFGRIRDHHTRTPLITGLLSCVNPA